MGWERPFSILLKRGEESGGGSGRCYEKRGTMKSMKRVNWCSRKGESVASVEVLPFANSNFQ